MKKRRNYWDSETFPLVENRHVVGVLRSGKHPYHPTVSPTDAAKLEKQARDEAPPRHCLCCGKVLVKRARITVAPNQDVVLSVVEYGYRGKGYWDTLKCMRKSAPKLAAALIKIGVDTHTIPFLAKIAKLALNRFHHNFD